MKPDMERVLTQGVSEGQAARGSAGGLLEQVGKCSVLPVTWPTGEQAHG